MNEADDGMRVHAYGTDAVLVEVPADRVLPTYEAVLALLSAREGVTAQDVVPAARTVLVDGLRGLTAAELAEEVGATSAGPARSQVQDVVEVPTRYDGDDLQDVAELWDMTVSEVVATHTATSFVVAFCGFAPGFAYCTGLPEPLHVPRRRTPRPRVPAGSVGLAGEFTGVYPTASPGGWQLLGRTDLQLWNSGSEPPATLSPGRAVRFVDVGSGA